jgi:hypothetical protein
LIKWLILQLSNHRPIKEEREDLEDVEEEEVDVEVAVDAVVAEEVPEEVLQRTKPAEDGFQLPSLDVSSTRS